MYIKSLRIRNTRTDAVMREVIFHKGANFIVDAGDSPRHNKVGKTTFLKLIDVLMGAQNKSHLYLDQETNNEAEDLRDIINEEKKVAAEMTIVQSLDAPHGETHELKVELFSKGKYFIDNERMAQKKYRKRLNEIFFHIDTDVPTFRQLINSFVRVSVGGDNDAFLRTLVQVDNATYRAVYNFLFDISDPTHDKKLSDLNKSLHHITESLRRYRSIHNMKDRSLVEQEQVLTELKTSYEQTKYQLDNIFDSEKYKSNRDAIAAVRASYAKLRDQLDQINYRLRCNETSLEAAHAEHKRQADLTLLRKFFDEVCPMLSEINKTFEEMVDFNNQLVENKIIYFKEIRADLLAQRKRIEAEQKDLLDCNSQYLSLIAKDQIDEYEKLMERLMQIRENIGKQEEIINTFRCYESKIAEINNQIDSYSTGGSARSAEGDNYRSAMQSFNKYFRPFAKEINGEEPILVYSNETAKFPISIDKISGSSTGTRKSLIAAFDLAYQQFAIENHIFTPRFVVHDVIENIEGNDLHTIIKIANEVPAQYIVAVLKEKLGSSQISEKEQSQLQILRLAEGDKLFEGKTVDSNDPSLLL